MTTELTNPRSRKALSVAEATHIQTSWQDLLERPIGGTAELMQMRTDILQLQIPTTRRWVAGRVATLMSQYFVSSAGADIMEGIAEDWIAELEDLPSWAIQKACQWWMGHQNPDRRKRPLAGDISLIARKEMGIVRVAEMAVERHLEGKPPLRLVDNPA